MLIYSMANKGKTNSSMYVQCPWSYLLSWGWCITIVLSMMGPWDIILGSILGDWVTVHKPKERFLSPLTVIAEMKKETVRTLKDPNCHFVPVGLVAELPWTMSCLGLNDTGDTTDPPLLSDPCPQPPWPVGFGLSTTTTHQPWTSPRITPNGCASGTNSLLAACLPIYCMNTFLRMHLYHHPWAAAAPDWLFMSVNTILTSSVRFQNVLERTSWTQCLWSWSLVFQPSFAVSQPQSQALSIHWGQIPVYWSGKCWINCEEMENIPSHYLHSKWWFFSEFTGLIYL